jgi:benzoyl-CoA reductase/2-hydroxyglutaryl-CoA dehydratase subunit BcrC/BadD/HgdB
MPRMSKPSDLSLAVLKQIRDAVTQTREELSQRIDQTNQRLDQTNQRLDQTREELSRRQTETEIRLATEFVAVVGAVHSLRDAIVADRDLRRTVEDHEQRLGAIERRTG